MLLRCVPEGTLHLLQINCVILFFMRFESVTERRCFPLDIFFSSLTQLLIVISTILPESKHSCILFRFSCAFRRIKFSCLSFCTKRFISCQNISYFGFLSFHHCQLCFLMVFPIRFFAKSYYLFVIINLRNNLLILSRNLTARLSPKTKQKKESSNSYGFN